MAVKSESIPAHRLNAALINLKENQAYQYGLLVAFMLLAAFLRFYKLGQWSLWIDEIFTINHARLHFSDPITVIQNLPTTLWLPLSVILANGSMKILGVSEWSARLASALIGSVSIPILYFQIRKIFGSGVALITVLLLAVSPWHLFWSQNARFYTSLMLLYTLASFAFFFGIERDHPKYLLLFYILLYFAVSERLIAIYILPVITVYLAALWFLPFEKPPGLRIKNLLFLAAPVILAALIEFIRFTLTGESITSFEIANFGGQQFDDPLRLFVAIVFNIGLPILSLALFGGIYLILHRSRSGLFVLLSAVVPFVLLILLNPFTFTKDRYVFMTLPFWLILAAVAVKELITQTKDYGRLLAVGVLFLLLIEASGTNLLYYQVNNGNRRDWREAFEIIKEKSEEDDIVVAWWPQFSPFYLGKEIIPWKDIKPETVVESGKRYWFLVDSETVWGNVKMRNWILTNAELVEVLYLRLPEDDFHLRIYLYDPEKADSRE